MNAFKKALIVSGLFLGVVLLREPIVAYSTVHTKTITVLKEQRITDADGKHSRYLVWDTDGNVYENVDSMLFFKFNSSDVQGALNAGSKVTIKTSGIRFGFMSWYPNIISATPE
jgi:hypothetical protein